MNFCTLGLAVIETEAAAVFKLTERIDERFNRACELLLACKGRIVVTGMGKSGHIGKKIAATLSSTGSPAFFMHPSEALHGDLGMITPADTILALSSSGNTEELLALLPRIKRLGLPLITLTGNPNSPLADNATVNIDLSIQEEACPLGLAPTTSTTVALVMGDALAISLLQARGFTAEDFAHSHPGGTLGRKLLLKIDDLCHHGNALPVVEENKCIRDGLIEVSSKKLGMACVVNTTGHLTGIFTDGDIRRSLSQSYDINQVPLKQIMTKNPHCIKKGVLAADALLQMQTNSITALVVTDNDNKPTAVLHIHDLLRAGVV